MLALREARALERVPFASLDVTTLRERVRVDGMVIVHTSPPDTEVFRALLEELSGPDASEDVHVREWEFLNRPAVTNPSRQLKKSQEWHFDESWTVAPPNFAALMCIQAPTAGGGTEFIDMRCTLDALDDADVAFLRTIEGCHSFLEGHHKLGSDYEKKPVPEAHRNPVWHPAVRLQPGTRNPSLFANRLAGAGWRRAGTGGPAPEVPAVVDRALAGAEPYVHRWLPGDMILFDNSIMLHRRSRDAVEGARRMVQVRLVRAPVEPG